MGQTAPRKPEEVGFGDGGGGGVMVKGKGRVVRGKGLYVHPPWSSWCGVVESGGGGPVVSQFSGPRTDYQQLSLPAASDALGRTLKRN